MKIAPLAPMENRPPLSQTTDDGSRKISLRRRSRCNEKYFLLVLVAGEKAIFSDFITTYPEKAKLQGRGRRRSRRGWGEEEEAVTSQR